jgi:hypothetical protein
MQCPRCQQENRPRQRFCGECGTTLSRSPSLQHVVLRLLQRLPPRADLPMQPQLVPVLGCRLRPALEPEVFQRPGMATEPDWDEVVELIVLRGAGQSVGEPAFDGIRHLSRWAHLSRVAALADCGPGSWPGSRERPRVPESGPELGPGRQPAVPAPAPRRGGRP